MKLLKRLRITFDLHRRWYFSWRNAWEYSTGERVHRHESHEEMNRRLEAAKLYLKEKH